MTTFTPWAATTLLLAPEIRAFVWNNLNTIQTKLQEQFFLFTNMSWNDAVMIWHTVHNRDFPDTIPPDTVNIHFIENPFLPFWRQTLNLYVWAFSCNSHRFSICGCYLYEKTIELSYSRFKFGAHKKPYGPPLVWRALSRHSDCSRRSNIAQYILEWHMIYIRQYKQKTFFF